MSRVLLGAAFTVTAIGCLPRERVNTTCTWREDDARHSAHGQPPSRTHLRADVRLAEDLAIRYADALTGRRPAPIWEPARTRCLAKSLAEIARGHGVRYAAVEALLGSRDWWFDLFAILLPVGAILLLVSVRMATRLVLANEPADWWLPALLLTVMTPLVAGIGLAGVQIWGWLADWARLGNEHMSYRVFQLPSSRYGWQLWIGGMILFAAASAVAMWRVRRDRRLAPGRAHRVITGVVPSGSRRRPAASGSGEG